MSIRRVTISIPEDTARRLKQAAGSIPVSAWVTRLIEEKLDDTELEQLWRAFYEDVAPGPKARRRADAILKRRARRDAA